MKTTDEEKLGELRSERSRLIWFTKHPDELVGRRIKDVDKRIKELEKQTRIQT